MKPRRKRDASPCCGARSTCFHISLGTGTIVLRCQKCDRLWSDIVDAARAARHARVSFCCDAEEEIVYTSLSENWQDWRCTKCGFVRVRTLDAVGREDGRPALRLVWSDGKAVRS